ncbi:MAG TPA: hypothetical protein VM779_00935 [Thermoanaerobaculia bacterium]|nr:hypothetical protein [Thermoanaerobaculia bacterium]
MTLSLRFAVILILTAASSLAQAPPPPEPIPPHDITGVDIVPESGAIATPLPEREKRRLKKYEIPELTGARQAIGPQLIEGRLPRPILDYGVRTADVDQRISFFEGGLVVVRMTGAGGTIHKRILLPDDAVENYLEAMSPDLLRTIRTTDVSAPAARRRAFLRLYEDDGVFVERAFDPAGVLPKILADQVMPLEDLLRALSEDRTVTNTVANYEPKVGDRLVADDRKVWRVARITPESGIVELRCVSEPTIMYVAKQDLYNYFVGRPAEN